MESIKGPDIAFGWGNSTIYTYRGQQNNGIPQQNVQKAAIRPRHMSHGSLWKLMEILQRNAQFWYAIKMLGTDFSQQPPFFGGFRSN